MKHPSPTTEMVALIRMCNAGPHQSKVTMDYPKEFNLPTVLHPPFSPDLAQSDFYQFWAIKEKIAKSESASTGDFGSEAIDISHIKLANLQPRMGTTAAEVH
jgi:hypothetical protein